MLSHMLGSLNVVAERVLLVFSSGQQGVKVPSLPTHGTVQHGMVQPWVDFKIWLPAD